jgi:predicted transcriptional regulator
VEIQVRALMGDGRWIWSAFSRNETGPATDQTVAPHTYTLPPLVTQAKERAREQSSIDSALDAPYAGFMNLQVPPELEAKLNRLAMETGRSVDQVALDLLASSIDHDEWFRTEVEKGRVSAREGRLLEHDDVAGRMDRKYRG